MGFIKCWCRFANCNQCGIPIQDANNRRNLGLSRGSIWELTLCTFCSLFLSCSKKYRKKDSWALFYQLMSMMGLSTEINSSMFVIVVQTISWALLISARISSFLKLYYVWSNFFFLLYRLSLIILMAMDHTTPVSEFHLAVLPLSGVVLTTLTTQFTSRWMLSVKVSFTIFRS